MKLSDIDYVFNEDLKDSGVDHLSSLLKDQILSDSVDRNHDLIERGTHLLEATIRFMQQLDESIGAEEAAKLQRKYCNSIVQRSHEKFERFSRKAINEKRRK